MPKRTLVVLVSVLGLGLGAVAPLRLTGQEERAPTPNQEDRGRLNLPGQPLGVQKDWEYKQIWPCQASPEANETATAILAENDEIVYDDKLGVDGWTYGYDCKREVFDPANVPVKGTFPEFSTYFGDSREERNIQAYGIGLDAAGNIYVAGAVVGGVARPRHPTWHTASGRRARPATDCRVGPHSA